MNRWPFPALIVGAAVGCTALPAHAVICYEVIDRTDAVVFRDTRSPVDLSEAGARSRAAMRERGELLVIFDTQACIVAGRLTGSGARKLTVEEIVAEWRNNSGTASYGMWSPSYDHRPSPSAPPAATAPAPSTAPTPASPARAPRSSAN
jgi:hypothetical protein